MTSVLGAMNVWQGGEEEEPHWRRRLFLQGQVGHYQEGEEVLQARGQCVQKNEGWYQQNSGDSGE